MKQGYETSPIVYSDRPVDKHHGRSLDSWGKVREGAWRGYIKALNTKQSPVRQNKLKKSHIDSPLLPASAPLQSSGIFQSQERPGHAAVTNWYWNLNGPTKVYFLLIEFWWTTVLHVMTDPFTLFLFYISTILTQGFLHQAVAEKERTEHSHLLLTTQNL